MDGSIVASVLEELRHAASTLDRADCTELMADAALLCISHEHEKIAESRGCFGFEQIEEE
jgi:hypothetical protein